MTSTQRKTVVLVCMVDSIHVARWIAQFDPTEVRFILFPSGPNRRVHPKILEMIENGKSFDNQIRIVPFGGKLSLPLWALDRFFSDRIRGLLLRRILKEVEPDFVHALEFQHAGYVTIRALEDKIIKTPFIATNYGSDIYWFQQFPGHRERIVKILKRADMYSAECSRDYRLANSLGFCGKELPVGPNGGGLELPHLGEPIMNASNRFKIVVKGYHGWSGRALLGLEAIEFLGLKLREFEILVYSATPSVIRRVKRMNRRSELNITFYKKNGIDRAELLKVFQNARVHLGLSMSDGISTALLEAMSRGAFPIQTHTSCADEWVQDGRTGLLIKNLTREAVAEAVLRAVSDDELVDNAQRINLEKIWIDANPQRLKFASRGFYGLV